MKSFHSPPGKKIPAPKHNRRLKMIWPLLLLAATLLTIILAFALYYLEITHW